jgi:hypothetical protein
MQVIGNQQGQPLEFLTSFLRRGGGLFANTGASANRRSVPVTERLCGSWSFLTGHQTPTAAVAEL